MHGFRTTASPVWGLTADVLVRTPHFVLSSLPPIPCLIYSVDELREHVSLRRRKSRMRASRYFRGGLQASGVPLRRFSGLWKLRPLAHDLRPLDVSRQLRLSVLDGYLDMRLFVVV
jgi:hypothetical protein